MSTNDVPQCDNVIVARGRQAEGRRLPTASAVVMGIKGFDFMLPEGHTAKRRDGSFRLRTLGRKDALRPGTADAVGISARHLSAWLPGGGVAAGPGLTIRNAGRSLRQPRHHASASLAKPPGTRRKVPRIPLPLSQPVSFRPRGD